MRSKVFILSILLLVIAHISLGANLKRILRAIEKQNYEKAIELLEKEILEEEVSPGAYLIYADLISTDTLPYYDLELAREYIDVAIQQFDSSNLEIRDDLEKVNIRELTFQSTFDKIKLLTFEDVMSENSLESYEKFLSLYPNSEEAYQAINQRDSIAFEKVKIENTWEAYKEYMDEYPLSRYKPIAAVRYQRLLYVDKTKSGKLEDLEKFVEDHPDNPFREDVIDEIYLKRTLDNSSTNYRSFIKDYPSSRSAKMAIDFLYHLDPSRFFSYPETTLFQTKGRYNFSDSIRLIYEKDQVPLLGYLKSGKTGLMTLKGENYIQPVFDRVFLEEVYCEVVTTDIIGGSQGDEKLILNRISEEVYRGNFNKIIQVGQGVLWIDEDGGKALHKSGKILYENVQSVSLLGEKWLILERDGKLAVASYNGEILSSFNFDEIFKEGNFWIFRRGEEYALYPFDFLNKDLINRSFLPEFKFDDLELVSPTLMIGFRGMRECLLTDKMRFLIPWGNHTVFPDSVLYYSKNSGGSYSIFNTRISLKLGDSKYTDLISSSYWLSVKDEWWRVYNRKEEEVDLVQYDSVKLVNDWALFTRNNNLLRLVFPNKEFIEIDPQWKLRSISSPDLNYNFVQVDKNDTKEIYSIHGELLFEGSYDEILHLSDTLFKIIEDGKQGVVSISGNMILEPEYSLVQYKEEMISTLRDGKIGSYDLTTGFSYEPAYESSFTRSGPYFITSMDGRYGMIDTLENEVTEFEFKDIQSLNDSLYWAKTDSSWQIMKVGLELPLRVGINSFEKIIIGEKNYFQILTNTGYGIISPLGEALFNPVYSDIRVLQYQDQVTFRSEKYFVEADYYILVWYNEYGKKVYSAAYRSSEYEPFYCE